ncbi:hypothetical protein [Xanthomonas graminis]|uniref:hypothetical protein n=1 Tax=Xanthomonas graminis TaxID=3390026 RepID=UPI00163E218B|nr:hypothetical protein [Xanthomonas translucens]
MQSKAITLAHIRNDPNRIVAGPFSAADNPIPSNRHVCTGSMLTSSQNRALA